MSRTLRPARDSDVKDLVEMRALMFAEMGVTSDRSDWRASAGEWFMHAVDDPSVCLVVVEDNGALLACGMAEVHPGAPGHTCPTGRTAHVSNLVTRRSTRRPGLASQCMAHLLKWAAEHADRVELHASDDGAAMYRLGGGGIAHVALPAGLPNERTLVPRRRSLPRSTL